MGHRDDAPHYVFGTSAQATGRPAYDRRWASDLRDAVCCAVALLALLLLIDWGADTLTAWRVALWSTLATLLFLVLCPDRVAAGRGWLVSRRLLRTRGVRTDVLVSVRCRDGVAGRLVLRDVFGDSVEIDPRVLVNNPDLWHLVHEGARKAMADGCLLCGATALHRLARRIDRETARTVFEVSDLD